MIKIEQLKQLLSTNEEDLQKLDIEQLRTVVGTFRYLVRLSERELNHRCSEMPLGNLFQDS